MVAVICENCGKKVRKLPRQVRKWKHHFCSKTCHLKWLSKNRKKRNKTSDWSEYNKLKEFAEKRKQELAKNGK